MVQAIQTRYGGYRMRSRLEARWAVFFDTLGLRWAYEIEGLRVPTPRGKINYLPDFWLPEPAQWIEVKGLLNMESVDRLCAIASSLAECGEGNDVVVLGEVPRPRSIKWPVQLHFHGKLWAVPWSPEPTSCPLVGRGRVAVEPTEQMAAALVDGFPFGTPAWASFGNSWSNNGKDVEDAMRAARGARFEWGESG